MVIVYNIGGSYFIISKHRIRLYRAPVKHSDYHWWTQHNETIIDATADQYYSQGLNPPYEQGKLLQTRTYGRDVRLE